MDFDAIKWVVGLFTTLCLALVVAFRHAHGKIADVDKKNSANSADLHKRIDDVKDDYVRRVDLEAITQPIRDDLNRVNTKLDRLIERK